MLTIDPSVAVIAVIFGLTFLVLRSFLFKPVLGLLEERKAEASSARAIWEETKAATSGELEAQRGLLSDARVEARKHREDIRKEAQAKRQEMLAEAKREAEERLAEAQAELDAAIAEQRGALEQRARRLSEEMTVRLLGRAS